METKYATDRQEAYGIYTVSLEGMHFHAHHGCLEAERRNGNEFRVDFHGTCRSKAGATDCLEDAIDYGAIYKVIAAAMQDGPFNLLETLCHNILCTLKHDFPGLESICIRVAKKNPPVDGPCEWSAVQREWRKDE